MKAQELMIGDWVMLDKTYPSTSNKPTRLTLQELIYIEQGKECEPIQLTPEILEKNDLDKVPEVSLVLNSATTPMYHSPMIHYVHELQHALRLCGLNELADNFKV